MYHDFEALASGEIVCEDCGEKVSFALAKSVSDLVYPEDSTSPVTYTVSVCPTCYHVRQKLAELSLKGC